MREGRWSRTARRGSRTPGTTRIPPTGSISPNPDPDDTDRPYDARTVLEGLEADGTLSLEPDDHEVSPGVRVILTPGHTPGHRSVVLTAGDESLLLTGDLLHLPIQVAHPEWRSSHDVDPDTGAISRVSILTRAREQDWHVAVSHFARPFGHVVADGWSSNA